MSANDLKASLNQFVFAEGIAATITISDEDKVRFIIANAASNNVIQIEGRIIGQDDWDVLETFNGNTKKVVKVATYDQMRVNVITFAAASGAIRVIASSFNEAGGSTAIGAPTGGIVENDVITFTSSDSSVSIVADPLNNSLDFKIGVLDKFVKPISLSSWTSDTEGYILSIPFTEHNKPNPVVTFYEDVSGNLEEVEVVYLIDTNNNVTAQVLSSPDTRFSGKVFIN